MVPHSSKAEIILEIVRGTRPVQDLKKAGIEVRVCASERGRTVYDIANPAGVVAVAGAIDIAMGLLRHLDDPASLQQWAITLETGASFLDLRLEDNPSGELLLYAVWKASFGEPLSEAAVSTAKDLVRSSLN